MTCYYVTKRQTPDVLRSVLSRHLRTHPVLPHWSFLAHDCSRNRSSPPAGCAETRARLPYAEVLLSGPTPQGQSGSACPPAFETHRPPRPARGENPSSRGSECVFRETRVYKVAKGQIKQVHLSVSSRWLFLALPLIVLYPARRKRAHLYCDLHFPTGHLQQLCTTASHLPARRLWTTPKNCLTDETP